MTSTPVMSITDDLLAELEEAAKGMQGWTNNAAFGVDGDWSVGCIDEDGNKYPVIEMHPEWYDQEHHGELMASYYARSNPATVLSLIDCIRELSERADKYAIIEQCMGQLESDEREGGIWTACTLLLIGSASKLNSDRSEITQEGVTIEGKCIGDWKVTVERIAAAPKALPCSD